jgi:CrcB protein
MIARLLLVCLGGALGSGARYLVSLWAFPYGTLIVNLVGSFLIGIFMQLGMSSNLRLALTTGVMGGFTTYSAFNYEATQLAMLPALAYVGATVIGCLVAGFAGLAVGKMIS